MKIKSTKLLAILLAVCMMFSFSSVVFAANTTVDSTVEKIRDVYTTYEEEIKDIIADIYEEVDAVGLLDKAVKALDLAGSKLDEAATIAKNINEADLDDDQKALKAALVEEIALADDTLEAIIALLEDGYKFDEIEELKKCLADHLDVVKTLSYELSKAGLVELIADVRALYEAALKATYHVYPICGGTVDYVALGGTVSVNTKYAGAFEAELAKKLPAGIYNGSIKCTDLTQTSINTSTVAKYIDTNKNDIANADLITFNMDAIDALVALYLGMSDDVDWSDYNYAGSDATALAEKAIAKLNALLARKFDADKIEKVEKLAENLAYAVVSYGIESYKALETIIDLNADAKIIVLGMVNPFVNVFVEYDKNEDPIPLYDLFDLVIEATDIYNGIYAMFTENVTFVSVADAEANATKPVKKIDITGDYKTVLIEIIEENKKLSDGKTSVVNALLNAIEFEEKGHNFNGGNVCVECGYTNSFIPPLPSAPTAPEHFNCDGGENCYCNKYTDLDNTMWYHQGVCYMIEHGYMIGIGDGKWAPEQIITRAEIATILWRIAGSEEVDYALDFSDVEADMWYTEAIEWAVSEEIFLGYGDGKFGPNDQITREQMVTVMYRYELDNGKKLTADFDMTTVSDADEISEWAEEAMTWALDCGLIIGTDVDVLTASPLKTATRAEVAMIFYRKLDNLLK